MGVKSAKKTSWNEEKGKYEHIERREVQNKLGEMLLRLNSLLMFPLAVYLGATKTIGMANQVIKPSFNMGFFFDDAFIGTAPFLLLLVAWNAQYYYFYSDRARVLLTICAYFFAVVCGVVATLNFSVANLCVLTYAALVGAANLVAFLRYESVETDLKPKTVSAPIPRLFLSCSSAVLLGLIVLRVLLGVDELSSMPLQPHTVASPLIVLILALSSFCAASTNDVQVVRAHLLSLLLLSVLLSSFFNIKPGFFLTVVIYTARASAIFILYLYSQKPIINGIISQYRGIISKVTKVGGLEGYGDE